jgi:hypothetical protein
MSQKNYLDLAGLTVYDGKIKEWFKSGVVDITEEAIRALFTVVPEEKPLEYQMVDLGLPSGTLWATCNIGAETETGSGYYFSFTNVDGHNLNNNDDYIFSEENYTYNEIGSFIPVNVEYDPAYKYSGGILKLPSEAQYKELYNFYLTNGEFVENYNNSGVNGYKLTGNNSELFIPVVGYYDENGLNLYNESVLMWTNGNYVNGKEACVIDLDKKYSMSGYVGARIFKSYCGLPIRGVQA